MMRSRLDLPEPFRPSTPILAPGKNDREMSLRMTRLGGTVFPTRFIVYTYCAIGMQIPRSRRAKRAATRDYRRLRREGTAARAMYATSGRWSGRRGRRGGGRGGRLAAVHLGFGGGAKLAPALAVGVVAHVDEDDFLLLGGSTRSACLRKLGTMMLASSRSSTGGTGAVPSAAFLASSSALRLSSCAAVGARRRLDLLLDGRQRALAREVDLAFRRVRRQQRAVAAVDELAFLGELLLRALPRRPWPCARSAVGAGSVRLTGTPCLSSCTLALFDGLRRDLVRVVDHALLVDPLVGRGAGRRRERDRSGHEQRDGRPRGEASGDREALPGSRVPTPLLLVVWHSTPPAVNRSVARRTARGRRAPRRPARASSGRPPRKPMRSSSVAMATTGIPYERLHLLHRRRARPARAPSCPTQ